MRSDHLCSKPARLNPYRLAALLLVVSPWLAMGVACSTPSPQTLTSASSDITTQVVPKTSAWDGFCAVAKPMTYSAKDTAPTIEEARESNCLGEVHCGWPRDPYCKVPAAKP